MISDVLGKDQPQPPASPDYVGAAQAQGGANLDATIASGVINRPNEYNPFGSRTWNQTGTTMIGGRAVPNYDVRTTLSPEGQMLFDNYTRQQAGLSGAADTTLSNLRDTLSKPFDITGNRNQITDAMFNRYKRLMDPVYGQQEESLKSDLINKGFSVNDEGYDRAVGNFTRNKDMAYNDLADRATTTGAQQAISEALLQRQQPLTELNSLRTGANPTQPNFQPYASAGQVQAAPIMAGTQAAGNAAMQQYGIQSQNYNNMMSGLSSLGSAWLGAPTA